MVSTCMRAGRHTSEPSRHVYREQPSNDRACIGRHLGACGEPPSEIAARDVHVRGHFIPVRVRKRRRTHEQLEEEDAQPPPITRLVHTLVEQHLGRRVVGRAAASIRPVGHLLGQPKVAQQHEAPPVDEHLMREAIIRPSSALTFSGLRSREMREAIIRPSSALTFSGLRSR